jgi:predicted nucleotidyltransferase
MSLHGIEIPEQRLAEFCRANNIRRLALFGSILRDDFGPHSDIDVLVEFKPGIPIGLRFFEIQDQLSQMLGRKVDLNTPGFLSKRFRERVMQEALVQYESN